MFLDSIESLLSQESIHMLVEGSWCPQPCFKVVFVSSVHMGHSGHISDRVPPTSEVHIFHVRTPFQVFLDSMESPLSQDAFHIPVEGSG